MRHLAAAVVGFAFLLVSCTPAGGSQPVADDSALNALGGALEWDRAPDATLVRIETVGGSGNPVNDLNTLPFCVLYGDGHVIWLDPYADPEQMLEDRVSEQTVRGFMEYIIGTGFYSWDPIQSIYIPTTEEPDEGPILEQIAVTLYGETHVINALSDWPPTAFADILERCRTLSAAPVYYVPAGVWVSVVEEPLRSDIPSLPWDMFREAYPDINLAAMTLDNPLWATGDFAQTAWQIARRGRLQITENGSAYRFIAQVPGLQAAAPPPPEAASGS